VVVTGEQLNQAYAVTNASTALKLDIPLLETPQAVTVVNRALLDDQNARKLDTALRNVAGVTVGGYYSDWDYYRIRGFDAAFSTYLDGLFIGDGNNEELWGLERVEVVKGPNSSLYGPGPLGGLVNLISKRPRPENFVDVQFTAGSYNFYEPAVDLGMTLNKSKSAYFRLNALYRDEGSFVDYAGSQRVFVAPALTLELTDRTKLTLLTSFKEDWIDIAFPLPAAGTVLPNPNGEIPVSRYLGEPSDPDSVNEWNTRIGYEFNHQFSDILSLNQNFRANWLSSTWNHLLYPAYLDADQRTLWRYPYSAEGDTDGQRVDTSLLAAFDTGKVEHSLLGGVDYRRNHSVWNSQEIDYADPASYIPIDIFNPVYGAPIPPFAQSSTTTTDEQNVALYLQDHARLFERLTLTLAGSMNWTFSGDDYSDSAFVPRAGVTYEFIEGWSGYFNYSQSFYPQWAYLDASGQPVEPETGENFEVGLKTALWNNRLNASVAVYQLTRQNVATDDPFTPDPFDSIVTGEQRSRGVELEADLTLAPGWQTTVAYSYIDAKITQDNLLPVGAPLPGVPENSFSAWMKYTLQDGLLRGLGFGVGGSYYSSQEGDITYLNPFELPAYGLVNAAVFYQRNRFRAQVNVNNVLDNRYFVGAYNDIYVLPGSPLNVRGTVGWTF